MIENKGRIKMRLATRWASHILVEVFGNYQRDLTDSARKDFEDVIHKLNKIRKELNK
jgi:hypothetical protein